MLVLCLMYAYGCLYARIHTHAHLKRALNAFQTSGGKAYRPLVYLFFYYMACAGLSDLAPDIFVFYCRYAIVHYN